MRGQIDVFPDRNRLALAATQRIQHAAQHAIDRQGRFTLVLSGGSTPRPVYELLSQESTRLDWAKAHVFWGDERCLPPENAESNYRVARETLLDNLPIPHDQVHRIHGEESPTQAAESYEQELRAFFTPHETLARYNSETDFPAFDLILLGMGNDGHTASLFPGSPALEETRRWVVAVDHDQPPPPLVPRITLTLPVINAARTIIFLVSGESKADRLEEVIRRQEASPAPAARVQPKSGSLVWLLDEAAALRILEGK
jgi:6-phosphogluconolactonase